MCSGARRAVAVAFGLTALSGPVLQGQTRLTAMPDNVALEPPPPPPGVSPALDSARAIRGAGMEVSVYVYGPGDEVFERFGHIALAIADGSTGQDIAFNWGMFDFNQPNFLGRFLTGDTRYWMAGYPTYAFNAAYQAQNRTIRQLTLELTPTQRGALADFVAWNAREQNRYYRYDYYRDNCSTRVRDALDWALGGALQRNWTAPGNGRTWRGETARITADNLPVYAGIQLALGRGADRPLSIWDDGFLPDYLGDHLTRVRNGAASLVRRDTVLYAATRTPMPAVPPRRLMAALGVGLVMAGLIAWLGRRPGRIATRLVTLFGIGWFLVGGVLGTALLLAATVTRHAPYMGMNQTLLVMNPLWLLVAATWPWRTAGPWIASRVQAASLLVAVLGVLGALLGALMQQQSGEVYAVTLPIVQALALVAWQDRLRTRAGT